MIWGGSAKQFGLAIGDLDGEIDAAINERAEAFEVGEQRLDPGLFCGPNVAGATAHVVGGAELPVGAGLRDRILVLPAEGTRTDGPGLSELGLGPSELGLPLRELFIFHGGELRSHWWLIVSQLRPACSRQRTFLWLAVTLAAMGVRRDPGGGTSFVRARGIEGTCLAA